MNNLDKALDDKAMLADMLSTEKFITANYNMYANEACNPALRSEFMDLLREEHDVQYDVFNEMSTRGFYPVDPAEQAKIAQVKQTFSV